MTEASLKALSILRSTANFEWYIIPIFMIVLYIYVNEIGKKNWHGVLVGLGFWGAEFIWEMFNSLVLHWSNYAGMWGAPGHTAYLIYSGLNAEICLMFALAGLLVTKSLPEDTSKKIAGMPNRVVVPVVLGLLGVFVEVLLNQAGALTWDYAWWNWPNIWLLIVAYVGPCFIVVYCYDKTSVKTKVLLNGLIWSAAALCHIVFALALKWI